MPLQFTPAIRHEAKARVAMIGPTGAGKTWTALQFARTLAGPTGTIGVIDTENASSSLYADAYVFQTAPWYPPYDAAKLAASIHDAAKQFDVLVIDSLTHFWQGDGGVLDIVEQEGARNRGNKFAGWAKGTPLWRSLLDSLIFAPCHVIVTMRSKMDYVQTTDANGRAKVEKMGMAPVARNDVEYEFTIVAELDQSHRLTVTKSRCSALADQVAAPHQSNKIAETLSEWLSSAEADPAPHVPPAPERPRGDHTEPQMRKIQASFKDAGIVDRDAKLAFVVHVIGREMESSVEMTKDEAGKVIEAIEARIATRLADVDAAVADILATVEPAA